VRARSDKVSEFKRQIRETTRRNTLACACHNEVNCDDKLLNFPRNFLLFVAYKYEFTLVSREESFLYALREKFH
jgi:hypothetical protein